MKTPLALGLAFIISVLGLSLTFAGGASSIGLTPLTPAEQVAQAWHNAQTSGAYAYRSQVNQTI